MMAGAEGIEPSLAALEADVLPLNYAPIAYWIVQPWYTASIVLASAAL